MNHTYVIKSPLKKLDIEAEVCFSGWQHFGHIATHWCQQNDVMSSSWLHRARTTKALSMVLLLDSAIGKLLSFTNFNLYPFPVIIHNHEYKNSEWVLWVLLAAAAAKSLQSCLTLCDPIDGSPPGSPIPGILQTRTLEWVAISFSNNSLLGNYQTRG